MAMQTPRYVLPAALLIAALLPLLTGPARAGDAVITVKVIESKNDRGVTGALVEVHPDQRATLTPAQQRGGEYVFRIRSPATCFTLSVSHDDYQILAPLYGLSAHTNQTLTIVLFPKPSKRLHAMNLDDAKVELAAIEACAALPSVVGEDNVSEAYLETLKDADLLKQLKEVAEGPNKEWDADDAAILVDKAEKILKEVNKLPDAKQPPAKTKPPDR